MQRKRGSPGLLLGEQAGTRRWEVQLRLALSMGRARRGEASIQLLQARLGHTSLSEGPLSGGHQLCGYFLDVFFKSLYRKHHITTTNKRKVNVRRCWLLGFLLGGFRLSKCVRRSLHGLHPLQTPPAARAQQAAGRPRHPCSPPDSGRGRTGDFTQVEPHWRGSGLQDLWEMVPPSRGGWTSLKRQQQLPGNPLPPDKVIPPAHLGWEKEAGVGPLGP